MKKKANGDSDITSKRLPRPDWRHKIDFELYSLLEEAYVDILLEKIKNDDPAWKFKTLEVLLAKASAKARMIPPDREEQTLRSRKWYAKEIKNISERIKWKRKNITGEFIFVTDCELQDMFPGDKRLDEIHTLQRQLSQLKIDLNIEVNWAMGEEAERDNKQLLVTLRGGNSRVFHSSAKVNKVIVNSAPKVIHHNGRTFTGKEVLQCFVESAVERSGEIVNVPGTVLSEDYLLKKYVVMMAQKYVCDDDSFFVNISKEKYNEVCSQLPSSKSPDLYGMTIEHLRFANERTNDLARELFNGILSDIRQFSDPLISISLAQYICERKKT